MILLFWASAFVVVYVYLLYPALLGLWARVAPRPVCAEPHTPPLSIIVAARNEAERLSARLDNLLELDYPLGRLQIVVVSDGSTDATAEILTSYAPAVESVLITGGGKARALNEGVARARHDILVFADVRQRFAADALRALVAPLADPTVGGVSGELILDAEWREQRLGDWRGRRRLLEVREVAAAPGEPHRLDDGRDRRHLRAAPTVCGSRCRSTPSSMTCWRRCAR